MFGSLFGIGAVDALPLHPVTPAHGAAVETVRL
jgi:hypothetical protein